MNRHLNELTFLIIYNNYKANITFKKLENIEKFTDYLKIKQIKIERIIFSQI